jgi:hypothetical protein
MLSLMKDLEKLVKLEVGNVQHYPNLEDSQDKESDR